MAAQLGGLPARKKIAVEAAAKAVLEARADVGGTLNSLYASGMMPRELTQAHRSLDVAVDACYGKRFKTANERLQELFNLYKGQLAKGQGSLLDKRIKGKPRPQKSLSAG